MVVCLFFEVWNRLQRKPKLVAGFETRLSLTNERWGSRMWDRNAVRSDKVHQRYPIMSHVPSLSSTCPADSSQRSGVRLLLIPRGLGSREEGGGGGSTAVARALLTSVIDGSADAEQTHVEVVGE